ncbi:GyrI-like domain-containing protein [Aureivirga sp. CE67]|uniref:AraC family transcriptional regulator n=1 Tax=Aureivirga sp. CE67 TaxID=1788983 RepID=UPI0018C9075E|nr:AraC family transcriptional regulator [Aureivirga sp. CE67]
MNQHKNETEELYLKKINQVFEFIDSNLEENLTLEEIAKVSNFSPYHFHRIFKFITKETLNQYITRKRIEKSASLLLHQKDKSITAIFLELGFENNTTFTRTFKKFYQINPTEFRKGNQHKFHKIKQQISKNGKVYPSTEEYICILNNLKKWFDMNAKIEVKNIQKMHLAYVTIIGEENISVAYQKLIHWAKEENLFSDKSKMLTIYHDSFKITKPKQVRMSACMILEKEIAEQKMVDQTILEEQKCIVGSFEIHPQEFEKAWTSLFIWMNENNYKKADKNPFEIYHNNFEEHLEKKCIVDFHIPIQ